MKAILIIVPYNNIYPPMNGGMQRCFHILHQLARHFNVTAIINQDKNEFLSSIYEYAAIEKINIYSTKDVTKPKDLFRFLPQKLQNAFRYRWYKKKFIGPADGLFLSYYPILRKLLKRETYDVIILENLASFNAISVVRRYDRKVKIVYDAHNVDTKVAGIYFKKREITQKRLETIKSTESTLYKTINGLFVCSQNDKNDFLKMNKGQILAAVIPNGVNIISSLRDSEVHKDCPQYILFCGFLGFPPNSEGLLWFHNSIWAKVKMEFPSLKLLVVGNGDLPSSTNKLLKEKDFVFTGPVADVKPYYNKASISIVPLKTGSGTRLKILEAMSYGVPVVSTSIGAEGIECKDGLDILIADREDEFANKLIQLLKNKEQRLSIQQHARELVKKKYDWNVIGGELSHFINEDLLING